MTDTEANRRLLLDTTDSGCGCGCGTSGTSGTSGTTTSDNTASNTSTSTAKEISMASNTRSFGVQGLTCGHCVGAVSEEIQAIPGVTGVEVDLVAGGTSTVTVTSESQVDDELVAAALDEAGNYQLAGA